MINYLPFLMRFYSNVQTSLDQDQSLRLNKRLVIKS